MKITLLTIILSTLFINAFGWGDDVMVGPQSTGKATLVSTANGTLYASICVGTTGVGGMKIWSSTDQGQTWIIAASVPGLFITKTKLVVTGTDSVYCIYQVGYNLYTYSMAADISTPFTIMAVDDWDVAASPNSNSIYLYTDNAGSNALNRYSSRDGGYTWTGSQALVDPDGAHPSVTMSDTILNLFYYGPVSADTTASIIRSTFYWEAGAGNLTTNQANFADLITNGMHHNHFKGVSKGNNVWLFYSEGDSSQSLNVLQSTNYGQSFGSPMTVVASPNGNADCFDATTFSDAIGNGVRVAYFFESNGVRQMYYTEAYNTSPAFSTAIAFNDFDPECSIYGSEASICSFGNDVGVIFQEDSSYLATYFDRLSAFVGIENVSAKNIFRVYPNPAKMYVTFESVKDDVIRIEDLLGKSIRTINIKEGENNVDVSDLSKGVYIITNRDDRVIRMSKE